MRKWKTLIAVSIGVVLTTASAMAQEKTMSAKIPFDFAVKDQTLPAGEYIFSESDDHGYPLLSITNKDGNQHLFVNCNSIGSGDAKAHNELVFHRYGDQYVFSEMWAEGTLTGSSVPASNRENDLGRRAAASKMSILAIEQPK
jgi:hypothetical protein